MARETLRRNHLSYRPIILLLVIVFLIGACSSGGLEPGGELTNVRLIMPFRPDVQFAPFYVAVDKGYYADVGIDVAIEHFPENEAVALVGAGEADFAVVSGEQVLLARAQELPVVYVMAWWHDYPVAVAVPEESSIHTPSDLVGKKIGIPGFFGASYIGFRALLSSEGIREDAVILESIGYNQIEAMLAEQQDAVVVYANNEPLQLKAQGLPVRLLRVADYVKLASNGIITNEQTINEDPDLIRKLVAATLRGIEETLGDMNAAFEISKGYVEGLEQGDSAVLKEVLAQSASFWVSDTPGASDPDAWLNMHKILLEMGMLEKPLEMQDAYSNKFLP